MRGKRIQADANFLLGGSRLAENDARFSFSRALPVLIVAVVLVYLVPIQLFSQKIGLHCICVFLILLCNEFQCLACSCWRRQEIDI
jgi:hypothetical protein